MTKYGWYRGLLIAAALVVSAGCGASSRTLPDDNEQPGQQKPVALTMQPLYSSTASGISYSSSGDKLIVSFSGLAASGQFIHIGLPEGVSPEKFAWVGDDVQAEKPAVLTLAVPTEHGVEIGAVPLATYSGNRLTFFAALTGTSHEANSVPTGEENTVDDLRVVPASAGRVSLSWTQHNAGDYNFDGNVDLADMRAVAEQYGESVDRLNPASEETTAYWVDGQGDGSVEADDIGTILEHYGASLAGYNVRRNGELISPAAGSIATVPIAQAAARAGLPPRYSVEMGGLTTDTWAVAAVGPEGAEGATGVANPYLADLSVSVNITGIDLLDLLDDASGDDLVVKWSTRVIDPTEIIGRPTLAKPTVATLANSAYTALPRAKQLLLDIRYLPAVDLATGAIRTSSALHESQAADDAAGLQITAVPFMLPDNASTAVISAEVNVAVNPAGGYYVYLTTRTTVTGQPEIVCNSRLSYVDGVLSGDADGNGAFSDEAQFLDDDRDQVSNQRIEQAVDNEQYPAQPEPLVVQGDLLWYDAQMHSISLTNIELISGTEPAPLAETPLFTTEDTAFAEALNPNSWSPGDHLSLDLLRLSDPSGGMPPVFWVGHAERLQHNDASNGQLTASDDQPWQIEVSWVPLVGYTSYLIERYEYYPGFGYGMSGMPLEFPAAGPTSFIDYEVAVGQQYRYKYYGLSAGMPRDLLGEETGVATAQGDPGGGQFFSGVLLWIGLDSFAISDLSEREVTFFYDNTTMWIVEGSDAYGRSAFSPGDLVQVMAFDRGDGWAAFHVAKADPGAFPGPPPGG